MNGPFLTVKLDGWWVLDLVGSCVEDWEGVDIGRGDDQGEKVWVKDLTT